MEVDDFVQRKDLFLDTPHFHFRLFRLEISFKVWNVWMFFTPPPPPQLQIICYYIARYCVRK